MSRATARRADGGLVGEAKITPTATDTPHSRGRRTDAFLPRVGLVGAVTGSQSHEGTARAHEG